MAPGAQHHVHVAVEEFIRRETQAGPETDQVIRVEKQIEVAAAAVEAADTRVAAETERVAFAQTNARKLLEIGDVELSHGASLSLSSISAMVCLNRRRTPSACWNSDSSRASSA